MTDLITGLGSGGIAGAAATAPQTKAVLSSDFETFIKMLTTQAEYQDPLEPLDSSEYAAQLAQFSMVEQQVLSNDLLSALAASLGGGTIAQLSGWIGMEARTTQPVLFDGSPLTVLTETPPNATEATLNVYDSGGTLVDRRLLPTGAPAVQWAGVGADGTPVPAGLYRFEVESIDAAGEPLPTALAASYARVTELRTEGTQGIVVFAGGSETTAESITALREAS
ncbi:flagellar biosynthesis protein FlgD [Sulfitobacter albidus]|uniref:Basal-body rod modification protein FlgD n=1 Tax=Sulfitobacter albidus TaxID=2829501 RepID=A0A975JD45_9RHOB|nr:flagellar hook capping FlgD N-terminal domain-containing protein [Sulfitobacter albidus]QUJ76282.1 flagellar biosynthesis protein FlgD [Sulfitobacter albidus]